MPQGRSDEDRLTADIIELARQYGRYGYRRIAALLRHAGWHVNDTECGQLIARAEETLTAEAARPETARVLRVSCGEPVVVIDRLAKGFDETPLEWRRSRGRADQFHYHTEIR